MSDKQLELLAAVYADQDRAQTICDMLEQMHRATTITMDDAAIVTKGADGKLQIHETREVTTAKGAKRGAIAAGLFGLVFPPSLIVSAVAGGAVGALWGKLRDTGIKTKSIKDLGERLEPGKAAVVALVDQASVPATEKALQGYDGELIRQSFTAKETAEVQAAASEAGSTSS
ncbi:MAG: DUF1269 domain-containing protein [Chloroflexi bacterium]|nr:DUF1269 domain-containing protein [Chloroflexota bacterium]